jgi:acetolactate synthase-1/2/3 large subunit
MVQLGPVLVHDVQVGIGTELARDPAEYLARLVKGAGQSPDGGRGGRLAWVPDLMPLAGWDEAERKWRKGWPRARL